MSEKHSKLLKEIMRNLQILQKESGILNNTSAGFDINSQIVLDNNVWATNIATSKTYKKEF